MGPRAAFRILLAVAIASASTLVPASDPAAEGPEEASVLRLFYDEGELVTTASLVPEEARLAPATVEVFTAEDIENMGARTLSDLLRTLESVLVTVQTNSRESIWFRGVRNRYNDKVLLLVDGIPRRDPVYQHASVDEYLPLTNVERVEVIRGPGSALYGTNAFAGVINVITKRPGTDGWGEIEAGGGNFDTAEAAAEGAFRWGPAGIYAFAHGYRTDGDGLDYQRGHLPQTLRQNPKRQWSGGVTVAGGGFTARLERLHYKYTFFTDWDVPTWRWDDEEYVTDDTFASVEYAGTISPKVRVTAVGFYQDYRLYSFWREFLRGQQGPKATPDDVRYANDVYKEGKLYGGDLRFAFDFGPTNKLTVGASYERESVSRVEDLWTEVHTGIVTRPFYIDPVGVDTWAVYLEDVWKPAGWVTLTAGVRGDHNGIFGWQTSPRLGATFHPGRKLVAKLLYGEAFRAPSFREFFTVDMTGQFPEGNRALKPESIRTFEASLDYTFSSYAAFHLLAYRESTSDAIYSEDNLPYSNHPGDTIYGAEAGLKLAWPNRLTVYLNGSYIWTDLCNIPHKQLNGGFNAPLGKRWNWSLQASWLSERPRDPDDRFAYDPGVAPYKRPDPSGYLLVNSTLRLLEVVPGLEFRLSVTNLFDRDFYDPTYEPTKYYDLQAPGRTFLLRAVYRF